MNDWLQYRLEELEFHNGARMGFGSPGALMRYRDDNREIAVTDLKTPPAAVDAVVRKLKNPDGTLPEIKTIYYQMLVDGYPPQAFFYHPMKRGVGVVLEQRPRGQNVLYFNQREGRTIFSKDWTLREVTDGNIPIDKRVWQFHGYQHEH